MTPVADPFMADARPTGLQRGRGGFLRAANDTPWVTHPDGVIVATGPRKGEPLRVPYGQPSKAGTLVENDVGLTKYKQRNTLLGIGMSSDLVDACRDLVLMEAGGDEFRKAADTIVVEADNLTRSWLAADRGSHGHTLAEYWDKHHNEGWRYLIPDGEALGITFQQQEAVVAAWKSLLADNGLEILAIEAACVDDRWRLAGTLDRVVRCTRELRFAKPDGEIVVIPAGTVLILDLKFGKIRRAHLIQVASYRQSVPYDTVTEQRGVWPWPIDDTHALIAHGDFGDDTHGPSFELVWVDVKAGREHGGQCVADAKAWSSRDDLWSVAQIVEGEVELGTTHPSASSLGPQPSLSTPDVEGDNLRNGCLERGASTTRPSTPSPLAPQSPAAATPGEAEPVADQPTLPPGGVEEFEIDDHLHPIDDGDNWHIHNAEVDRAEALAWASQPAPPPLPPLPDRPDEGGRVSSDLFAALKIEYDALLPVERKWISRLVSEAQQANVGFHTQRRHTERRYRIVSGLVDLCESCNYSDDVLRALCVAALGIDAPLDPRHTPGACVGSLDAAAAQRFAALVDDYVGTTV